MKQEVTCSECEKKKLKFIDHRDITVARWKILGLSINTGLPIVTCDTCDWRPESKRNPRFNKRKSPIAHRDEEAIQEIEKLA